MPTVSILMPAYNHELFVRQAIESVLGQGYEDFELLITDDGSTDHTVDVIRGIVDSRVSLVAFSENRGACTAMNASLSRAKGKLIAVLNSDDMFVPDRLAKQVQFLTDNSGIGAVFGQPSFVDANGRQLSDNETFYGSIFRVSNKTRAQWLRHFFLNGNCLCHPSAMIRRECYSEVGTYNQAFAQLPDFDMWVRLVSRFEVHVSDQPAVLFRILDNHKNASAPRPEVAVRMQFEWLQILENYLRIDSQLLCEAFPEIRVDGLSKRNPGVIAKLAKVLLDRILKVAPESSQRPPRPTAAPERPVEWHLAKLALQVGRPAHALFGLRTMYSMLGTFEDVSAFREFIDYSGRVDVFGIHRTPAK